MFHKTTPPLNQFAGGRSCAHKASISLSFIFLFVAPSNKINRLSLIRVLIYDAPLQKSTFPIPRTRYGMDGWSTVIVLMASSQAGVKNQPRIVYTTATTTINNFPHTFSQPARSKMVADFCTISSSPQFAVIVFLRKITCMEKSTASGPENETRNHESDE